MFMSYQSKSFKRFKNLFFLVLVKPDFLMRNSYIHGLSTPRCDLQKNFFQTVSYTHLDVYKRQHLDEDDPEEKLATTLYHEVFSGTPYERSILGSKDTIAHLKRENFIYHQEYFYHPSNLTLVVCGDLPENQLFEKIDQFYKNGGKPLQNLFSSFPPLPKVQRKRIEINMDIHHHYGAIGFLGPGIRQDDFCLLKFLSVILGDGIDSRLNARLREKEQFCLLYTSRCV